MAQYPRHVPSVAHYPPVVPARVHVKLWEPRHETATVVEVVHRPEGAPAL